MANILVHAVGASAGGGATWLRHFLARVPHFAADHRWIVLAPSDVEFDFPAGTPRLTILRPAPSRQPIRRLLFDQLEMRRLIREHAVDLILATGNFGMVRPPVPQILMNRNPLYFSAEHLRQLRRRGAYREALNIVLRRRAAIAAIRASAVNVTPTAAFGDAIRQSAPSTAFARFAAIHHGFDIDQFVRPAPLARPIEEKLAAPGPTRRILMVSHYNYFRNFETLLRGFALLQRRSNEPLELILTTKLGEGVKDHRYDTTAAFRLAQQLGIADRIAMLGTVPYADLYPLYRIADAVVCPAYIESFGHPMVEAMAAGRPVVAADQPVQREICRDSAVYFDTFNPESCANALQAVMADPKLAERLSAAGPDRAAQFSWRRHFTEIADLIDAVLFRPEELDGAPGVAAAVNRPEERVDSFDAMDFADDASIAAGMGT